MGGNLCGRRRRLTDRRNWLVAAIDLETSEFLYVGPFSPRNTGLAVIFFDELGENHVDLESFDCLVVFFEQERRGSFVDDSVESTAETVSNRTWLPI